MNSSEPDIVIETDDDIELHQSTEIGAKGIFRRFVFVLVVLEVIMGGLLLAYDIADHTATMHEKLEALGMVGERAARQLRKDLPTAGDAEVVKKSSQVTNMPMGLITFDGELVYSTEPALDKALPSVLGPNPVRPTRRIAIRQELGPVSGAWLLQPFSQEHHLLVIVPHLPESEGKLMYVTISAGVLSLGLALSVLVMLTTANWMLRHPLDQLVQSLTSALQRDNERRRTAEHIAIEARLDAEEHLAFLNNLINASEQVGIIAVDNDDRIQLVNRSAELTLGIREEATVGKMTLGQLLDRARRKTSQEVPLRSLMKLQKAETFFTDQHGKEHLLTVNFSDIEDGDGKVKGRLMVFVDITEQKRLEVELQINEMQLAQSAKLAMLGEMATGVAHELNQPLNNIGLLASRVSRRMAKNESAHGFELEKLRKVQEQVQRASKIIDQLRTFGRPSVLNVEAFPIRQPVDAVLELLQEQFANRGIDIQVDIPDNLPPVLADQSQLEQVLINLLNNAKDALEQKTPAEDSPWIRLKAEAELLPGDGELRICLHVQDNGPGMPKEVSHRIFEPFFTTKEVGKGTGLGLSISYGLVQGFGGSLAYRSGKNQGATFSVLLKTAAPPVDPKNTENIPKVGES